MQQHEAWYNIVRVGRKIIILPGHMFMMIREPTMMKTTTMAPMNGLSAATCVQQPPGWF